MLLRCESKPLERFLAMTTTVLRFLLGVSFHRLAYFATESCTDHINTVQCLPAPSWPLDDQRSATGLDLSAADVVKLLGPAISIALVGYMESMTIAKTVERQVGEKVSGRYRLRALQKIYCGGKGQKIPMRMFFLLPLR